MTTVGKVLLMGGVVLLGGTYFLNDKSINVEYKASANALTGKDDAVKSTQLNPILPIPIQTVEVTHITTPPAVKAIYMTSWAAGTKKFRDKLVPLLDTTEANAIVIDIKDYTGKIAFSVHDPDLQKVGSSEKRIPDITTFIATLHEKGIYVIGRIAVFQDPYFIKVRPDLAVKKKSDPETPWVDHKGISWIDASSKDVWDYTIKIAEESYAKGFDEINLDYVRFPSDGDMKDIMYPISGDKKRSEVMKEFFAYIGLALKEKNIVSSVDVFGLVTTSRDDLGIGQVLEDILPYVDYVYPMVYPSHYAPGSHNFQNPAEHPYEIINISMKKAVERAKAINIDPLKLRPWIQDFDLGAKYTAEMIRKEITATYDAGLTSWLIWDPANTYTPGGLLTDEQAAAEEIIRLEKAKEMPSSSTETIDQQKQTVQ